MMAKTSKNSGSDDAWSAKEITCASTVFAEQMICFPFEAPGADVGSILIAVGAQRWWIGLLVAKAYCYRQML